MAEDHLLHVKSLLDEHEIIEPSSKDSYRRESLPWAAQKDLHPRLVVRPTTLESLRIVLAYLAQSPLDFAVRSQGFGSSSAKDVLISMTAFDEFEFHREEEYVIVGAGQTWKEYYTKMEQVAPDYNVVACRTPCIGIGGSILCGGFSWLSAQYGLTSDPQNMLDAQVVKLDGRAVWASNEPDLLWALRGAGGSFGVVTAFKLRAYPYKESIFAGPIYLPRTSLKELAKAAAAFTQRSDDAKMGMFLYMVKKELRPSMGVSQDTLVVHAFDANGEEHGRSDEGFGWALKLEGARDETRQMNLKGMADLQEFFEQAQGLTNSFWSPLAIKEMTEDIIVRSFEWFEQVCKAEGSVKDNGYLIFEVMQKTTFNSEKLSRSSTAWPHPLGARHILLLGTGCRPDADESEQKLARKLIMEGHDFIFENQKLDDENFVPNTIEDFHDTKKARQSFPLALNLHTKANDTQIFGEHYERLCELKSKYDPGNKLKGPINVETTSQA